MWEGTCEKVADVNCQSLIDWVSAIPLEDWPQNYLRDDRQPVMASETWKDLKSQSRDLVNGLRYILGSPRIERSTVSVIMPGRDVFPHTDKFSDDWLYRVHVPLTTNDGAIFVVEDVPYQLKVGYAYKVNVCKKHSVANNGAIPRIHFMFDCYE